MNKGETYFNKIAQLADEFIKKGYKVILMGFCNFEGDTVAVSKVADLMNCSAEKYVYQGNVNEAFSILSEADIIFATRFHAMILGWNMEKRVPSHTVCGNVNW